MHFSGVEDDDDDMVVDLHHKKSKVGPETPLAITGAAPATPPFFLGDVPSVGFRAREEFTLRVARRQSW